MAWTGGGDVRAGGGKRGISTPTITSASSSSSSVIVGSISGLAALFRPSGMPRYPGEGGPESTLGV